MSKQKLFTVHRIDFVDFGDVDGKLAQYHHYSDPIPEKQANELAELWKNLDTLDPTHPVSETIYNPKTNAVFVQPMFRKYCTVEIQDEQGNSDTYVDGKRRKITVDGQKFEWMSDGEKVLIYELDGKQPIYGCYGDTKEFTPDGVKAYLKGKLGSNTRKS